MSFFDLPLWHMNRKQNRILYHSHLMPHFCILAAIVNAPQEVFIIAMPHILFWQPFILLCGTIGNRTEFFIILMPHFCVVAAFYMLLQKSSLFLCHIFCCGSLPYTFVAPEQEIESNLCHYDFQPFKHPSLQLLIFIYSTQLGHIKSSALNIHFLYII